MDFRFSATVMGAAVAAFTCSTVNSGLISVMTRPFSVTSSTHISVMILLTQWEAVELLTEDWLTAENLSVGGCFTLARHLAGLYRSCQVDAIELVFTRWNSLLSQEPCVLRLLPLPQPEKPAASDKRPADILYEPDCATVFNAMIPEYLGGVIYGALCESLASELSARRMAMDSATQNADEMIDKLNLQYNRARQGSITQELNEIVAGAEE